MTQSRYDISRSANIFPINNWWLHVNTIPELNASGVLGINSQYREIMKLK